MPAQTRPIPRFTLPFSTNYRGRGGHPPPSYLLSYAHRSRWSIGHQRPPAIALCSGHSGPVGPLLFQLCFSVSPPTVARPASLPLPLRVPGQGLACGAGSWLPEGVSDSAPLPPQYLLGLWFLSRSLPQIFISDLLLPLDFVDAPQTGVEECLDLSLHRLCCPPRLNEHIYCVSPVIGDF